MDAVKGLVSMNVQVLKEPRGLVRIIQFVLAIISFAVIVNSGSVAKVQIACAGTANTDFVTHEVVFSYPFRVQDTASVPLCNGSTYTNFHEDGWASSAEFFVFVGVTAFLLSMALLLFYVYMSDMYANNPLVPKVDFVVSAIWAALFFIASIAWAAGLNKLAAYMNPHAIVDRMNSEGVCDSSLNGVSCLADGNVDDSAMIASCLFGFLNAGVWAAGLWFIFKETSWHKESRTEFSDNQPTNKDFDQGPVDPSPYQGSDVPPQNQF